MRQPEKFEGILGENVKSYIMRALAMKRKDDLELDFNSYAFVIRPHDTYDTAIQSFRHGFYAKILPSFIKPQQNLDYMVEELPSLVTTLDNLLGWLVAYSWETQSAACESHRWRVVKILTDAGFRPLDKNVKACPKNLLTLELIVGSFLFEMIAQDTHSGTYPMVCTFVETPQYQTLKRTMDRKNTIDEILKTL